MDDLLGELEPPALAPEERERRRRLVAAIGIAALSLVTVGTLSSGAWFTDTQSSTGNSITTGSVILSLNGSTPLPFNVGNMAPGDTVQGVINVANAGSLGLRYAVVGSSVAQTGLGGSGANLADQLDLSVYAGATCTGTPLYGPAKMSSGPVNMVGSPTTGPNPGDRVLAAGANEQLCVQASLDGPTTGNAWQRTGTDYTFQFVAEQTKNNP